MTAWDKFQLGWLTYEVGSAGATSFHQLTPLGVTTKKSQGVFVVLPNQSNPETTVLGVPTSPHACVVQHGRRQPGRHDDRDITLPAGGPINLAMKAWYEIETCWDYAQLRVSTNGGTTWTPVPHEPLRRRERERPEPGRGHHRDLRRRDEGVRRRERQPGLGRPYG